MEAITVIVDAGLVAHQRHAPTCSVPERQSHVLTLHDFDGLPEVVAGRGWLLTMSFHCRRRRRFLRCAWLRLLGTGRLHDSLRRAEMTRHDRCHHHAD